MPAGIAAKRAAKPGRPPGIAAKRSAKPARPTKATAKPSRKPATPAKTAVKPAGPSATSSNPDARSSKKPASGGLLAVEAQLREHAMAKPEATEHFPWGERAIKVNGKVFLFMRADAQQLS